MADSRLLLVVEAWMAKRLIWLSDAEWARIERCCRAVARVRIGWMTGG